MRLTPEYWIGKTDNPGAVVRDADWIAAFNARSFTIDPNMVDIVTYPDRVAGPDVVRAIESVSRPSKVDLFYRDETGSGRLEPVDYGRYRDRIALDRVPETVGVRFGLMLKRSNMRAWPTRDFVIQSPETSDLDRFQENALFPGEMVAVLHESRDGKWYFVRSYNYHAWIRKIRVVLGGRGEVTDYVGSEPFLVVTGSKISTNFNPADEATSELQLDMGVRLPLVPPEELPPHVDGQNVASSHAVRLPVSDRDGSPGFRTVLIGRGQDVSEGYLPYTRENVIRQAFKFLGERYGWGHSYNGRDCTGLVLDIYRSMGIALPRNSKQQGNSPIGNNIRLGESASRQERLDALASIAPGDLLYSPGHVMIFLGFDDGEPWVIHHMSGSGWVDENGDPIEGIMNGVGVTPLLTTEMAPGLTYFETMYAIKSIG
jgi:hypothetical protein